MVELDNARVSPADFFAVAGVFTIRARFDPHEDIWRAWDDFSPAGDVVSTLNYAPCRKLIKVAVQAAPPPVVVLEWPAPVPVGYGTILGAPQFDAALVRRCDVA